MSEPVDNYKDSSMLLNYIRTKHNGQSSEEENNWRRFMVHLWQLMTEEEKIDYIFDEAAPSTQ